MTSSGSISTWRGSSGRFTTISISASAIARECCRTELIPTDPNAVGGVVESGHGEVSAWQEGEVVSGEECASSEAVGDANESRRRRWQTQELFRGDRSGGCRVSWR